MVPRAVVAAVLLTTCRAAPGPETGRGPVPAATASARPGFELLDVDARPVRLDDFRGRVVVVDFWATWCVPCIEEIPEMNRMAAGLSNRGGILLGVVFDSGERSEVREFVAGHGIQYRTLMGTRELFDAWGARGVPTTYVVGTDGRIRGAVPGSGPPKFERIDKLLEEAYLSSPETRPSRTGAGE